MHASFDEKHSSDPVQSSSISSLPTTGPQLLTKYPCVGATQLMISSVKDQPSRELDAGQDGAPTQTFLGLALPQHLNKGLTPKIKRSSDVFSMKAQPSRRCLITLLPQTMQGNQHVWFWPETPVYILYSHVQVLVIRDRFSWRKSIYCPVRGLQSIQLYWKARIQFQEALDVKLHRLDPAECGRRLLVCEDQIPPSTLAIMFSNKSCNDCLFNFSARSYPFTLSEMIRSHWTHWRPSDREDEHLAPYVHVSQPSSTSEILTHPYSAKGMSYTFN